MRNKENMELIYDYTNKQMIELDKIVLGGLEGSMDSKTLSKRYFYHDMLYFINIELNAANYLGIACVERRGSSPISISVRLSRWRCGER